MAATLAPVDPPRKIRLAAGEQQRVELGEIRDVRDRYRFSGNVVRKVG